MQAIREIDDTLLKFTVAGVFDIVASGYGHLLVQRTSRGIEVTGYDIDAEVRETFLASIHHRAEEQGLEVDAELEIEAASDWLKEYFHSNSAVFLAWLLGNVRNEDVNAAALTGFTDKRLVWSIEEKKVVAVLEREDPASDLIWL